MFQLLPILDTMITFYEQPRGPERFNRYLELLRGNTKNDLELPIGGFNPMAKEHVMEKLLELKKLQLEDLMASILIELTKKHLFEGTIDVAFNLADDLHGGWTNRFSTDFSSKFRLNALVQRDFCTPFLWTSEVHSQQLIRERTTEYALRTLYWKTHPKPKSLLNFVAQEQIALQHSNLRSHSIDADVATAFLSNYGISEEETIIFNFFYGDDASESLGYPCYGMKFSGFDYCKMQAV